MRMLQMQERDLKTHRKRWLIAGAVGSISGIQQLLNRQYSRAKGSGHSFYRFPILARLVYLFKI